MPVEKPKEQKMLTASQVAAGKKAVKTIKKGLEDLVIKESTNHLKLMRKAQEAALSCQGPEWVETMAAKVTAQFSKLPDRIMQQFFQGLLFRSGLPRWNSMHLGLQEVATVKAVRKLRDPEWVQKVAVLAKCFSRTWDIRKVGQMAGAIAFISALNDVADEMAGMEKQVSGGKSKLSGAESPG